MKFEYVGLIQPDNSRLWRVLTDPPHYVLTHADYALQRIIVWACDSDGVVTDLTELSGTSESSVDHKQAIRDYATSL